jgi:TolA-binding protein
MKTNQHSSGNQDQPALEDDVLQELDRIDQSLLDELVEDTRLSSGVPEEQRGSDLQFIKMSGLTSPAADHGSAPESIPAQLQPPIDFYEEGVDDVDEAVAADIQGMRHGAESGSHIAELKDIVEELSREPADAAPTPPSTGAEPDSAPEDAFPEELESSEEDDFESALTLPENGGGTTDSAEQPFGKEPAPAPVDEEQAVSRKDEAEETASVVPDEPEGIAQTIAEEPEESVSLPPDQAEEVTQAVAEEPEESVSLPPVQAEEVTQAVAEEPEESASLPPDEAEEVIQAIAEEPEESVSLPPDEAEEVTQAIAEEPEESASLPPDEAEEVTQAIAEEPEESVSLPPDEAEEITRAVAEEPEESVPLPPDEAEEPVAWDGDGGDISSLLDALDEADEAIPGLDAGDAQVTLETPFVQADTETDLEAATPELPDAVGASAALTETHSADTDDASLPPLSLSSAEELLDELQAQEREVPHETAASDPGTALPVDAGEPMAVEKVLAEPYAVGESLEQAEEGEAPEDGVASDAGEDPNEHVFRRPRGRQGRHRRRGRRRLRRFVIAALGLIVVGGLVAFAGMWLYPWVEMQMATPAKRFQDAGRAFSEEDYRTAAGMYSAYAAENRNDPNRPEAQFRAALATQLAGDSTPETASKAYERAVKLFEEFLRDNPEHAKAPRTKNLLGVLFFKLGQYEKAIDILSSPELRLRDPGGALPAIRTLARAHAAIGDYEAAAFRYTQAAGLDGNPSPDEDYLNLGLLYESIAQRATTDADRRRYQDEAIGQLERAAQMSAIDPARKGEIGVKLAVLREKLSASAPIMPDEKSGSAAEVVETEALMTPQSVVETDLPEKAMAVEDATGALETEGEFAPEDTGDAGDGMDNEETRDTDS